MQCSSASHQLSFTGFFGGELYFFSVSSIENPRYRVSHKRCSKTSETHFSSRFALPLILILRYPPLPKLGVNLLPFSHLPSCPDCRSDRTLRRPPASHTDTDPVIAECAPFDTTHPALGIFPLLLIYQARASTVGFPCSFTFFAVCLISPVFFPSFFVSLVLLYRPSSNRLRRLQSKLRLRPRLPPSPDQIYPPR